MKKPMTLVEKINVVTSRLLAPEVRSSHNVMRPIAAEKAHASVAMPNDRDCSGFQLAPKVQKFPVPQNSTTTQN
jgi:hypothetical protein